jgi:hypothetical protein
MRWVALLSLAAVLGLLASGADSVPPVLRNQDPQPDVIVRLPGAPPAPVVPAPETANTTAPAAPALASEEKERPPLLSHIYPPSFEADAAVFCQKLIGQWTVADARFLLGEPTRQRPAWDDHQRENGRIYAFSDPTKRYREIELDFDAASGTLRTVFVYPWSLTWQDCRRIWGVQVSETEGANGRKFYSYFNRKLDVLVDPSGRVVSLGLY